MLITSARPPLDGYVAVILAVVIWGCWIVATRLAMLERHAPLDIALLREREIQELRAAIAARQEREAALEEQITARRDRLLAAEQQREDAEGE